MVDAKDESARGSSPGHGPQSETSASPRPLDEIEARAQRRARLARVVPRLVLATVAVAIAVSLVASGAFDEPARTVDLVREAGLFGVVAYLVAFSVLQPLGGSGHVFTLAAAIVWPGWSGFSIALAGAVGAAAVGFVLARYLAYDWVQARIPDRARRYEKWLVAYGVRGLLGIVVYRLLTFTAPPALLLIGTTRVRFGPMLLATTVGFAPAVALDVFLGGELFRWWTA